MNIRIGLGNDTHRLSPEKGFLTLGGIQIPSDHVIIAHSDGDLILHALSDAILGATGANDIGELFPDNLEKTKNMSSVEILDAALKLMKEKGYRVNNVDIVLELEEPKIAPYKTKIRENLARLLDIDISCVGFKGKTGEKVDAVGEKRAIKATCVVLLKGEKDE